MPDKFILHSAYKPTGDQPQAIDTLVDSINKGNREQVLLGVTGSGKTFTMANIIEKVNRPTLILAHNKTLAAQLCSDLLKNFLIYDSGFRNMAFWLLHRFIPCSCP